MDQKVITLCSSGTCCPVVRISESCVKIGEEGNLCVLTIDQWETLKKKVQEGEI